MKFRQGVGVLVALLLVAACAKSPLAGSYVSDRDRTPKDTLVLEANGTFLLREDGATFTGTWSARATELVLDITGGRKAKVRIEGRDLVDSGQEVGRWIRQ